MEAFIEVEFISTSRILNTWFKLLLFYNAESCFVNKHGSWIECKNIIICFLWYYCHYRFYGVVQEFSKQGPSYKNILTEVISKVLSLGLRAFMIAISKKSKKKSPRRVLEFACYKLQPWLIGSHRLFVFIITQPVCPFI